MIDRVLGPISLCSLSAARGTAALSQIQSALHPAGSAAAEISELWWLMLAIGAVVYLGVVLLLLGALLRRRADPQQHNAEIDISDRREGTRWIIGGGVMLPAVVLIVLFVVTLRSLGALAPSKHQSDLSVHLIGNQFWWEVQYHTGDSVAPTVSANEIHIPVGRPVQVKLTATDVIHSFWVPSLQGKTDLIPGRTNVTWLQANETGVYRGQCAEYCGEQHTKMAFVVVAHSPREFAAWVARERRAAAPAVGAAARAGQRVFMTKACASCHAIRGTAAAGQAGPDLTHIASRLTLAAGVLPNTRGHLGGWIANPQGIKPGNRMPQVPLTGADLQALLAFLDGLR